MKLTFKSILIISIVASIAISLLFTSSYLTISTNSCEKQIFNEKLLNVISNSQNIKPLSKSDFFNFIQKLKENQTFFLLTESGMYKCVFSNYSYFEVNEIKRNLINIPINFNRYEAKAENIERLKLSKLDYYQELDKVYFKEPDYKLKEIKEVKFYTLINLPIENNTVKFDNKTYEIEEIKNWQNITISNNSAILKYFLFNQSCIKSFNYNEIRRVYSFLYLNIELKDFCINILEKILNQSGIKIIFNEKYFENPIEIEIDNKSLFSFYIPFTLELQNKISTLIISETPIDKKSLEYIKFYSSSPIHFEENKSFKIFTLDIISFIVFLSVLVVLILKKEKIEFLFLLSFLAFLLKPFLLVFSILLLVATFLSKKFNLSYIFLLLISSISVLYNPVYTLLLPSSIVFISLIKRNVKLISFTLFLLSLPLFFFFEWLSFLLLVSSFLLILRNSL